MNRRRFLSLSTAFPVAMRDGGCAGSTGAYRRCFPDHLRALAAEALEVRRRAPDGLGSAEAVRLRGAWARETLWRLTGGMPARTPLAIRTTGAIDRAGYRMEKLLYESRPGLHVTANLYVPKRGGGPFPGVLFQMGHLEAGKGADPYQRACQALAMSGFVVLAFDPAGQGERARSPRPDVSPDDDHDRTGEQLLLAGETQTGLMLWDAVRSLDVLASRPEVDPARLASAGQSGGGTLTMLLAAVDDRLAAAAISCANTEDVVAPGFDPPGAVDDAEQDLPGAGPLGFDRWDLLYPLAPKPLLALVSAADPTTVYSPAYLTNGREQIERLRRAYALLGAPGAVRWVETAEPHGLSPARRLEMTRFLRHALLGDAAPLDREPVTLPEPEEATWVVPGGSVPRALGGRAPVDLARDRVAGRAASRAPSDLVSLLGLRRPRSGQTPAVLASVPGIGCDVEDVEVEPAPAVRIPAWLFLPRAPEAPRWTVIALPSEGRKEDAGWQALARQGHVVAVADVRGTGALAAEIGSAASEYVRLHPPLQSFAWAALILGESVLAQRVADVLALVEGLSNHPVAGSCPLALTAQGELTIPALFAAAIDRRIGLVHLAGGLVSYRSVLDVEDHTCPLASVLPGVLACTDLPEVAAGIGPRRVILTRPMDGAGRPVPLDEARALHRAATNVEIVPGGGWGAAALGAALRR